MSTPKDKGRVRLKERRRKKMRLTAVLVALLCLVIAGGLVFLARLPSLQITTITVSGASVLNADVLKSATEEALQGWYAYLIPKRLSFIAPTKSIASALEATFPEAGDIEIQLTSAQSIEVKVVERSPYALFCDSACYVMDREGYIYMSGTGGEVLRRYSGSISVGPIGAKFQEGSFRELDEFLTALEEGTGSSILSARVTEDGDVFAQFDGGGEIRFELKDRGSSLLESVKAVFASPKFRRDALDYADFRFGQKAVVKFNE
jgi:cell division septal protein FtsQ